MVVVVVVAMEWTMEWNGNGMGMEWNGNGMEWEWNGQWEMEWW